MTETTRLPARVHSHGCPSQPDRIERFTAIDPHRREVEIIRCINCGGQLEKVVDREEASDAADR